LLFLKDYFMTIITATDLALRTNEILDILAQGQSVTIKHNDTVLTIGTIVPPHRPMTVREALTQMPKISVEAARSFYEDIRGAFGEEELLDPWERQSLKSVS
jgi:antitoxin (DNA-binding transcriptional repressor) of toxin-antitoxin stability system